MPGKTMTTAPPWTGDIYPVFVTASVPLSTINRCLVESEMYAESWEMKDVLGLHFIQDSKANKPTRPTRGPLSSFTAPDDFTGKPASALKDVYLQRWANRDGAAQDRMSTSTFAILDQETVRDSTALLVSLRGDKIDTARCELAMVSQLLNGPEQGSLPLNPENWSQHRENGIMVYRRSWYDKLFPGVDLND